MIDPERYCTQLCAELMALFGSRLLFLGLQGSYLRGEATEESDIDIMTVIDALAPEDLDRYRTAIRSIGNAERACGFLCGRDELCHWNPMECCQLVHTTKPVYGRLEPLLPPYDRRALSDYIRLGAGDLYHALCHRYLYADPEKNRRKLPEAERSVFFLLQNLLFYETGSFPGTRRELEPMLTGEDRSVWDMLKVIGREPEYDFGPAFRLILKWCGDVLTRASKT